MVDLLKSLIPGFTHFEGYEIEDANQRVMGHHMTLMMKDGTAFGSGTSTDLNIARRICVAESIERIFFARSIISDEANRQRLMLDKFPSTCGFAAGFEEKPTIFRSVCEAIERRTWSKWIDEGFGIPQVKPRIVKPLSLHYLNQFDKVYYFQTPLKLEAAGKPEFVGGELIFSVVLGVKGNGVFPGSRVTTSKDEPWDHALLEAWRHLMIYENTLSKNEPKDVYDGRIKRFGLDGREALERVLSLPVKPLSPSQIKISELVTKSSFDDKQSYFVFRSLCEDFIGWDQGDENRFVY